MSKKRSWVIRGFSPKDTYDTSGFMCDYASFDERLAATAIDAIDLMKECTFFNGMLAKTARDQSLTKNVNDETSVCEFYSLRVLVHFDEEEYTNIRAIRTELITAVKHWAEKCTIKNHQVRGWRLNALKDPIFEKVDGKYRMSFDVILGRVLWYSGQRATISANISEGLVNTDVQCLIDLLDVICDVHDVKWFKDVI